MRHILLTSAVAATLMAGSASALTVFSDSTSFNGALGAGTSSVTETFDTNASGNSLTFSGVTSTFNANGNLNGQHTIIGGLFSLFIEGDAPIVMSWALPSNVIGIGFDVNGVNSSAFDGVAMTINDGTGSQTLNLFDAAGGTGSSTSGYAGFLGANAFSSVSFSGPGGFGASGDGFSLDNLQIVTQGTTSPVPLPAGGLLLLTGLAGIAAYGRKKKVAA